MDHKDAIKRFRNRRAARLGFETIECYDSVDQYRKRREARLNARFDADSDDETATGSTEKSGGHGNTKIPFGLCQREGIEIQKGWTPEDAWNALEGKGYSAGESYQELRKTGKAPQKKSGAQAPVKKDFSTMDYDTLTKEYEDHLKRYKEAEDRENNRDKDLKAVKGSLSRVKMIKERGDYHGETYEELSKAMESDDDEFNSSLHRVMKKAMDYLGHDVFEKDIGEVEKIAQQKIEELSEARGFGELNQEREEIQNALSKKAKEKFPKLKDCDTPMALESRLRADDYFATGSYLSGQMNFSGIAPETVPGIGRGLELIKSKFPQLSGSLHSLLINDDVDSGAYAHCEMHAMYDAQVVLSKRHFRDAQELQKNIKNDVKSGFHPKGTANIESVVTHEYGHAIDDFVSKAHEKELGGKRFCEYVLDRIGKNHPGMGRGEIVASVSRYAANNRQQVGVEWLAEAFSEYCCSKKPRPMAMEVGKIMTEFINNPASATAKPDEDTPLF